MVVMQLLARFHCYRHFERIVKKRYKWLDRVGAVIGKVDAVTSFDIYFLVLNVRSRKT